MNEGEGRYEEFKVDGDRLIAKIKEIVHQGNVRRIIIKDEKGATLIEVPLTIGVVGVILLPVWAALGAIAALAANFTIVVERIDSSKDNPVDMS
jgi:Flp pilus assembly pilin Flp